LGISYGAGSATTVAAKVSVKDSQSQGAVSQLSYLTYQGVSQGNDRAGIGSWLNEIDAVAARGLQIRAEETGNVSDPLIKGFAYVQDSVKYGKSKLQNSSVEPSSVRRNTAAAIVALKNLSKGFEMSEFKNMVPSTPDAELNVDTPEIPASPNSDKWPFKENS